jgi:hypothetical protein
VVIVVSSVFGGLSPSDVTLRHPTGRGKWDLTTG